MSAYVNNLEETNFRIFLLRHPFELLLFLCKSFAFVISNLLFKTYKLCSRCLRKTKKIIFHRAKNTKNTAFLLEKFPQLALSIYEDAVPLPFSIKLATQDLIIISEIDWSKQFEDKEDTFALNRFGWLLALLLQYPASKTAKFAVESILSWIRSAQKPYRDLAWESYSVAERLANWPFILMIVKEIIPIPDYARRIIAESMSEQLSFLLENLELNGRFTNNHILNDARGLYISGVALNHNIAQNKGKELFKAWTNKVFYPDGMLRDGSSHYQYLLCQRYEQVYYLSRYIDDESFSSFIEKWARLTRSCCDFFSVYGKDDVWRIPFFGDISPDFSPAWLAPRSKFGWELLKEWFKWQPQESIETERSSNPRIKGNFIRFDNADTVIFWHIASEKDVCLSHGHYDLGSFVLFREGREIFSDPGLGSYDKKGLFAKSAKVHNSILIDSFGPLCENYKVNLLNGNLRKNSKFTVIQSEKRLSVEIQSEGFKRLLVPVGWRRRFDIEQDKMVITDDLRSVGSNLLENRFQISPTIEVRREREEVAVDFNGNSKIKIRVMDPCGYECDLIRGNDTYSGEGCFSTEYGSFIYGTSIIFRRQLRLSQEYIYEIRW